MAKIRDLLGMRFERYVVEEFVGTDSRGKAMWRCRCDCGNIRVVSGSGLTTGHSKSCGCYAADLNRNLKTKHGMSGSRLYDVWSAMKARCNRPNNKDYRHYGGRGIRYHPDFETFEGFLRGIPDGYGDKMELDRIDSDGDYVPGNLRWATRIEQMNNTSRTAQLEHPVTGERVSYAQLGREVGMSISSIRQRVSRGSTLEEAISKPVRRPASKISDDLVRSIRRDLWSMRREDVALWHDVPIHVVNGIYYQNRYNDVTDE